MSFPMRSQKQAFPFLVYVDGVLSGRANTPGELDTALTRLLAYPYRNYDGVRWSVHQEGNMIVEGTPDQVRAAIESEYPRH